MQYNFIADCGWCPWIYTKCTGCYGGETVNCYGTQDRERVSGCPSQSGTGKTCSTLESEDPITKYTDLQCFIGMYVYILELIQKY